MSGKAGVYSRVSKVIPLADAGRKRAAQVAVLACGHARTGSKFRRGMRVWCRICTQEAKPVVFASEAAWREAVMREAKAMMARLKRKEAPAKKE